MREARFSTPARTFFDSLSDRDQADVLYLVLLLEQNAEVDNALRFYVPRPPPILRAIDDGTWHIVYHLPDAATVKILSIERAPA